MAHDPHTLTCLDSAHGESWALYQGDCVEVVRQLPDNSVDFSVYSPPFANLYTYSDSDRDMGNCADDDEFFKHYRYLIGDMHRVLRPGRLVSVHCKDLVNYKGRDGMAGLRDFPGDIIRAHADAGFAFHSRVTVWKSPVIEMQRTKAHGLLYKQLRADSTFSRQGLADYVLTFRKWATDETANFVKPVTQTTEGFPLSQWQEWASPVWMDIDQTDVLNVDLARDGNDEKHICLAEGSLVLTRDGYIPIEDVAIGDMVLTHMGRWRPVTAKKCNGVRGLVQPKAQGVADLRVTPDHKLWTRLARTKRPRKVAMSTTPEWVAADDTLGSYLNLRLPPVEESALTAEEWWIVGRWLGDGHLSTRGQYPHISCGHHEVDGLVERLGSRAGAVTVCRTVAQIAVKDLGGRLRSVIHRCGRGAAGKLLPAEALCLDREKAESLLSGYLSADGHYVRRYDRWTASSVSRPLLLGMAMVAQRARGVVASVYAGRPAGTCTIEGREVQTRQDWILAFRDSDGYRKSGWIGDDGAWKKVRSVDPVEDRMVWDIRVEEDESFTAEGCVVKNCPLQLDLIERCIRLWSNPGDVVFSPFAGIGSEGFVAVQAGRKFVGVELKDTYFSRARLNLEAARTRQLGLGF